MLCFQNLTQLLLGPGMKSLPEMRMEAISHTFQKTYEKVQQTQTNPFHTENRTHSSSQETREMLYETFFVAAP